MTGRNVIIILVLIVIIGGGLGTFFFLRSRSAEPSEPRQEGPRLSVSEILSGEEGWTGEIPPDVTLEDEFAEYDPDEMIYVGDLSGEDEEGWISVKDYIAKEKEPYPGYNEMHGIGGAGTEEEVPETAGEEAAPAVPLSGAEDPDGDGMSNDQELNAGTDPNNPDTDGDGLNDYEELMKHRTDPKNFDSDGDGLLDGEEVNTWKTNPLVSDSDGDGYSDGQEVEGGYNPLGPGRL